MAKAPLVRIKPKYTPSSQEISESCAQTLAPSQQPRSHGQHWGGKLQTAAQDSTTSHVINRGQTSCWPPVAPRLHHEAEVDTGVTGAPLPHLQGRC